MSVLDFVAALVAALAWPTAFVIVMLILRSHIPDFLRSVRKLKLSGFEVELVRARTDIETAVAVATETEVSELGSSDQVPLAAAIIGDPTTTILRTHGRLEEELLLRLKAAGVEVANSKSATQLVALGVTRGIFTESAAEAVRGVSILRNLVAHGRGERVTEAEAAQYVALVEATIFSLRAKPSKK